MDTIFNPPAETLRPRFIGLASGFLAGLSNALLARLLMRVIAVYLLHISPSFSLGGTAAILAYGVFVGTMFGLFYSSYFAKLKFPALVRGLILFLVLAVAIQLPGLAIAADFRAELMVAGPLGFTIFGLMNLAYCLTLAGLHAWLDKSWPQDDSRRNFEQSTALVLMIVAILGLVLLVFGIGGEVINLLT